MTELEDFESSINFYSEEIDFELPNIENYTRWILKILENNASTAEYLNYIFCNDDYLLKINVEYLNHDYYTDIISFPYSEFPNPIEGDIFISIDRVKENALSNNVDFDNELLRVMAHGVLHFLGHKDKSVEDQQKMRAKEEEMMALFIA